MAVVEISQHVDARGLSCPMPIVKTAQAILSLRLLFHAGLIQRGLIVAPKPLVFNWCRELRLWAPDLPFEVIGGDNNARRSIWTVSNCPLKLVNYEILTRDAAILGEEGVDFDVVVLDEAQRIKNKESKTAQVVKSVRRSRSWALTGTPIENRPEDLIHLFEFVDPGRIPPEAKASALRVGVRSILFGFYGPMGRLYLQQRIDAAVRSLFAQRFYDCRFLCCNYFHRGRRHCGVTTTPRSECRA